MTWAQEDKGYETGQWHLVDENDKTLCSLRMQLGRFTSNRVRYLPTDRRPALGRNKVCAYCRSIYLKTRPDLKGYFDKLNDMKDV